MRGPIELEEHQAVAHHDTITDFICGDGGSRLVYLQGVGAITNLLKYWS